MQLIVYGRENGLIYQLSLLITLQGPGRFLSERTITIFKWTHLIGISNYPMQILEFCSQPHESSNDEYSTLRICSPSPDKRQKSNVRVWWNLLAVTCSCLYLQNQGTNKSLSPAVTYTKGHRFDVISKEYKRENDKRIIASISSYKSTTVLVEN